MVDFVRESGRSALAWMLNVQRRTEVAFCPETTDTLCLQAPNIQR